MMSGGGGGASVPRVGSSALAQTGHPFGHVRHAIGPRWFRTGSSRFSTCAPTKLAGRLKVPPVNQAPPVNFAPVNQAPPVKVTAVNTALPVKVAALSVAPGLAPVRLLDDLSAEIETLVANRNNAVLGALCSRTGRMR
jgi:hypothetical protein